MSDDYVLFYSNKCLHSKELLGLLVKDVTLNQKFTKINVDNPNIKLPAYVKSVPTAIVTLNSKPNILVGSNIFKWYNESHKKVIENQAILDWDPHTMSGYSDGFSYISTNDVMKKSFSFLDDANSIITPDEKNYSTESDTKSQPKTELDMDYENIVNRRRSEVPAPPQTF
jgi:hypothetical protein